MKKKLVYSIFIVCLLFVVCAITIYAVFTFSTKYSTNIIVGKVENAILTSPTSNLEVEFTSPGDSVEYTYSVTNNDSKAYSYYYDLVLLDSNDNEISTASKILDMIYVYQDDEFYGVLKDFVIGDSTLPKTSYLLPNKSRSNVFKFELHNGALGLNLEEMVVYLQIDCILETTNVQKNIYVSTNDEFVKAVSDVNRVADKIIVLLNDLEVTTALNIKNNATIDLCGNTLTLSADITVLNSAILTIKDNMNNGSIRGSNNFILNDSTAFINPLVSITNVSISNYDEELLVDIVSEKVKSLRYINSDQENDLIGYYSIYLNKLGFNITSTKIAITNGVTEIESLEANQVLDIVIVTNTLEETIDLRIVGSVDVSKIIDNYLVHLSNFATTNSIQVTYDLFLPTRIEELNATISWMSSDATIMDNNGRLQAEAGNITLTATIKVNNEVYTMTYFVYAVQQDNLSKLQYLATQVENGVLDSNGEVIIESLIFTEINQSFLLPTTVEGDNYYTNWTNGKNLGIKELNFELESSYLYLTVNKELIDYPNGNVILGKLLSKADITLTKVTYSKAARIKIIGYFENGETVETYIAIDIDLPVEALQSQVFADVQNKLNSINVLQNILDTRAALGVSGETGDFVLPNMIDSIEIAFFVTDGETVYTIVTDENGVMMVNIDLTKLDLTDKAVYITCSIITYSEEGDIQYLPKKDLTFTVPGALTPTNFKSVDPETGKVTYPFNFTSTEEGVVINENAKAIFYSLKLQALQAYPNTKYDASTYLNTVKDSNMIYALPHYILMHDIKNTTVLKFENGDIDTIIDYYDLMVYQELIDWATGTAIGVVSEDVQPFLEQGLLWIESDGKLELSDGEITLILSYCERFPGFNNYWGKAINVLDNILSDLEEAELLGTLISDKNFVKIMEWLRSTNTVTLFELFESSDKSSLATELKLPESLLDLSNDGTGSISDDEERVLIYYVQQNHFDKYLDFYSLWSSYITRKTSTLDDEKDFSYSLNYFEQSENSTQTAFSYECYDPLFVAILEWATYSADVDPSNDNVITLEDFIKSNSSTKITSDLSFFTSSELAQTNSWLYVTIYLDTCYGNNITFEEWSIIVKYLNLCNITKINNIELDTMESIDNLYENGFMVENSVSLIGIFTDSGYVINTDIMKMLIDAINALYSETITNYVNLTSWAKSISYEAITSYTTIISDITLIGADAYRVADNFSIVSNDEYTVLKAYLSEVVFAGYNEAIKDVLISYHLPLDMDFQNNSLTDTKYNELLYTIDSQGEFKSLLDDIRYLSIDGTFVDTSIYDNLEAVSASELEILANTFADNAAFIAKLEVFIATYTLTFIDGVYTVTENANLDRTLSADDQIILEEGIEEILGTNTIDTSGLKYTFIPLEIIDEEDIKAFYAIRYFTNLDDLSFKGTGTSFLFDSTTTANNVFNVVANVTNSLTRLTFNYTGLSDISLITSITTLEYIDLRFNYTRGSYLGIRDINPILTLQEYKSSENKGSIAYLNVYKTDVNILYGDVVFAKIYSLDNGSEIYYELDGVETLYAPGTLSDAQKQAINACSVLHEIEIINSPYIILPTTVYLTDTTGLNIIWKIVIANSLVSLNNNKLSVNTSGNTGEIVISATVNVGEASYTRYFYVDVIYGTE